MNQMWNAGVFVALVVAASLVLGSMGRTRAAPVPFELRTDDSWQVIAPAGDLAGQPIADVGLGWEAANPGWNTDIAFDTSAWGPAQPLGGDNIWGSDPSTPIYTRRIFNLPGAVLAGALSGGVDDDALIYVNGSLVLDDQDGAATTFPSTDIAPYLVPGSNLIAAKAHDSHGGPECLKIVILGSTAPQSILNISANVLDSAFTPVGGQHGNGLLSVSDAADVVVESTSGLSTYSGGAFQMTASLFADHSTGGFASGEFRGGGISIQDSDAEDMLLGSVRYLQLKEVQIMDPAFGTFSMLSGRGLFEVTGGYLADAFGEDFGNIKQITFGLDPTDIDDFSAGFTGLSSITLGPIPEPATLALLALGAAGVVARRRRPRGSRASDS